MTWKICSSQKYAAGGTAWTIGITTAVTNLKARNWTITLNGVAQ